MSLTIGPWPGTGDAEPPTATVQPDTTVRAAKATTTCHFMRMRRVLSRSARTLLGRTGAHPA